MSNHRESRDTRVNRYTDPRTTIASALRSGHWEATAQAVMVHHLDRIATALEHLAQLDEASDEPALTSAEQAS
jgi:hypothetical protein